MGKKLYEILELSQGSQASAKQIRQAYRKLALLYHPDKKPGDKEAEEKFKEIANAYELLSDEEKKSSYDKGLIDESGNPVSFGAEQEEHPTENTSQTNKRKRAHNEEGSPSPTERPQKKSARTANVNPGTPPQRSEFFNPPPPPKPSQRKRADYHFFDNREFADEFIQSPRRERQARPVFIYIVHGPFMSFKQSYINLSRQEDIKVNLPNKATKQVSFIDQDIQKMERLIDALLLFSALENIASLPVMNDVFTQGLKR